MRKSQAFATLALLLMLTAGLPAPTADAQAPAAAMCFNRDPKPPGSPVDPNNPPDPEAPPQAPTGAPRYCPGGVPDTPNYHQGEPVLIRLENVDANQVQPWIKVTCVSSCHELADSELNPHRYYARWEAGLRELEFPEDFREPGPDERGGDAVLDRAPRYNSTWEVTAQITSTETITRRFNVWLMSLHRSLNHTVHPGEEHEIRVAGLERNSSVDIVVEKLNSEYKYEPVPVSTAPPTRPDNEGEVFWVWKVPREEAVRINSCPPGRPFDCYRLRVTPSSSTKAEEIMVFRVAVADLKATHFEGQLADTTRNPSERQTIERTEDVKLSIQFRYPGGRLNNGPVFTPDDMTPGPNGAAAEMRVRVEKKNLTTNTAIQVAEVPLKFNGQAGRWEATWTVARDLAIETDANYTLKLVEARDQWGNRVPPLFLGHYRVERALLEPVPVRALATLERTQEGILAFRIAYHNGTLFTNGDNATPLRGCFVRNPGNGVPPACPPPGGQASTATYENGEWLFRVRYPRDYGNLGEHLFVLLGPNDAKDKWDNRVNGTTTDVYQVGAAKPRIEFKTVMRGLATDELERGERVSVQALIQYHDGRPFNHTVRHNPTSPWARVLNATLTKRGEQGDIQEVQTLSLQQADQELGLWVGSLDLTLDVSRTPIGNWSFAIRANDTVGMPNVNDSLFHRKVVAAPIQYQQTRPPSPSTPFTSSNVIFEFQLHYPGQFGAQGPEVHPDAIRNLVTAQVYRWDAKNRTTYGEPVSGHLQPIFQQDRRVWSLSYVVPGNLFNGSYAFLLSGRDASGNALPKDAWSAPFSPQSREKERQVLAQPPLSVSRGQSATVVFAAADGDVGIDGTGGPVILVERWNDLQKRWDTVVGGSNARQPAADVRDHFGLFGVTTTTAIGTYRFVLLGREAAPGFSIIRGISHNFSVEPTEVTRAILRPPIDLATKGDLLWFTIEREDGDQITDVILLLNGREIDVPRPLLAVEGDHINATWRVPFEAPNGNYTVHVEGRDLYGNLLVVDTPNIEVVAASLSGKILGNPPKVAKRGEDIALLFGVAYPSGTFYNSPEVPTVLVFNDTGLVTTADVERNGQTFQARWTPPAATGISQYWFEVSGQGIAGNTFPNLRSNTFRLAPGSFERPAAQEIGVGQERLSNVIWSIPYQTDDRSVTFTLGYYGQTADLASLEGKSPATRTPVPHTLDLAAGRYVTRFVTDQQTPTGAYRFFMQGEDSLGNAIQATSNFFLVKPTTIIIQFEQQPQSEELVEGATLRLQFLARYGVGQPMTDEHGRPSVGLLLDSQTTTQRPDVAYEGGSWVIRWTAPAILKDGTYEFVVGGQDIAGNPVANTKSTPLTIETGVASSFAKVIPGFDVPLMLLGIAALALALAGLKRRHA